MTAEVRALTLPASIGRGTGAWKPDSTDRRTETMENGRLMAGTRGCWRQTRTMFWLLSLSSFCPALAAALSLPHDAQTPLGHNTAHSEAVLRRFPFSHVAGGRDNIEELFRAAEVRTHAPHTTLVQAQPHHDFPRIRLCSLLGTHKLAGARIHAVGASHVDLVFEHPDQHLPSFLAQPTAFPLAADAGTVPLSTPRNWEAGAFANSTYHALYHPLDEVVDFMGDLAAAHPTLVELVELGHSGEGREMLAMKLSSTHVVARGHKGTGEAKKEKAGFVITGAQHAREVGEVFARSCFESVRLGHACSVLVCLAGYAVDRNVDCIVPRALARGRPGGGVLVVPMAGVLCKRSLPPKAQHA